MSIELIWQHTGYGPYKILIFTVVAIKNQFSIFENTQFLFPVSIALTQIFEFWVMETSVKNQSKQKIFCGTHAFWKLSDENWVIWSKILVIQIGP